MSTPADLRTAVGFLTRVPVGGAPVDAAGLTRAALWFPVVGLLVGAVLGLTRIGFDVVLDPIPATLLALLAAIVVTGGLHEDGLADCADAVGAHVSRERRLAIARDSRVGTFGALAIVFMVAFPLSVLAGLDGEHVLRAALCAHVLGRWSTLPITRWVAPAEATSSAALVRASTASVVLGTAFAVAVALVAAGTTAGAAAAGIAALTAGAGTIVAVRSFGGVTGDTLGATNKLVELVTYATVAAVWAA